MKIIFMQHSPTSCHFISPWSKYSSPHPILKHPQSVNEYSSPSFTTMFQPKHVVIHMFNKAR
jgi:hypothetical protein